LRSSRKPADNYITTKRRKMGLKTLMSVNNYCFLLYSLLAIRLVGNSLRRLPATVALFCRRKTERGQNRTKYLFPGRPISCWLFGKGSDTKCTGLLL